MRSRPTGEPSGFRPGRGPARNGVPSGRGAVLRGDQVARGLFERAGSDARSPSSRCRAGKSNGNASIRPLGPNRPSRRGSHESASGVRYLATGSGSSDREKSRPDAHDAPGAPTATGTSSVRDSNVVGACPTDTPFDRFESRDNGEKKFEGSSGSPREPNLEINRREIASISCRCGRNVALEPGDGPRLLVPSWTFPILSRVPAGSCSISSSRGRELRSS